MFIGIIEHICSIKKWNPPHDNELMLIVPEILTNTCKIGDSIAVNGCCLTITKINDNILYFNVMLETINKTTFSSLKSGDSVHVEKAMARDTIDGHPITGHVFTVITLIKKTTETDGSLVLQFYLKDAHKYVKYKGCVAIDGVSLTVSKVLNDAFEVSLIPYTQQHTLLGKNQLHNVEFFNISTEVSVELSSTSENHMGMVQETYDTCENYMELARKIAKKGRITAPSNPWVGCVIVENNKILASGFHRKRGEKHAERNALDQISSTHSLETATLYCTLEPCGFTSKSKLQPPCVDAILERGIKNIVVGISDPDERVSGLGIKRLRDVNVNVSVLEDTKIQKSLRAYIHQRKTGKPYVFGKMAISLDGKISLSNGDSKWISCEQSRIDAHVLRAKSQAILIGTNTALQDDPQLTVRLPQTHELHNDSQEHKQTFLRCVIDTTGKVTTGHILDSSLGPVIILTSDKCSEKTRKHWESLKLEIIALPLINNKFDLNMILLELGKRGILQLLVEGGATLMTEMVDANLIDELVLYQAPVVLGKEGKCWYQGSERLTVCESKHFKLHKIKKIDTDTKLILLKK